MFRHICDPNAYSFSVEKDGDPLLDVLWADDVSGQAAIFAHDRDGNRIPDPDSSVGYEVLIVAGKIRITDHPRPAPPVPPPDPQPSLDLGWFGFPP